MDIKDELARLARAIKGDPENTGPLMERGRLYHRAGEFGSALNDFLRIVELDAENVEAKEYIKMINEILQFRHTDIYNP